MNTRIAAGGFGILISAASALAVPPTLVVSWAESPPPAEGVNYDIDDTDPDFPNLELLSESETWKVWSVDTDNPNNIGDIGDITATGAFNYGLTLEDAAGGPGARTIGIISLDPSLTTKFSKIVGGTVTGNMTGDLFLQESSGGSGGTIDFTIEGDLLANVTLPDVTNFTVKGNFGSSGNGFTMDVVQVASGTITVEGIVFEGTINIVGSFNNSTLQIGNSTTQPTSITIDNFFTLSQLKLGYLRSTTGLSTAVITLGSDIGIGAKVDMTHTEFSQASKLDLGTNTIAGEIVIQQLAGDIIAGLLYGSIEIIDGFGTGGLIDLSGDMIGSLEVNSGQGSFDWRGTLEVDGDMTGGVGDEIVLHDSTAGTNGELESAGAIIVHGSVDGNMDWIFDGHVTGDITVGDTLITGDENFDGDITIGGDWTGDLLVVDGGTGSNAVFDITGNTTGTIDLKQNHAGQINVTSHASGDIITRNNQTGSINITGDSSGDIRVANNMSSAATIDIGGEMSATGRILIDGECDGDIIISERTADLSQIRLRNFGSSGNIVVNDSEGDFDAEGDIYVGSVLVPPNPPPPDVTYDGSILLKKESGTSNGGGLLGRIKVVGCHATTADLDICECGTSPSINVTIRQPTCTNQVDWSCVSVCP